MQHFRFRQHIGKGFTLVELAVVIVIVGVLATFGVPRFLKSVERSKATEAFAYLSAVREAQERYHAREGTYADDAARLDIHFSTPRYFRVGTIAADSSGSLRTGWSQTLTRARASASYGSYTVTYTQKGYDSDNSTIDSHPDINPLGANPGVASSGSSRSGS
jgi:prepilin-type N-terminal cleavage/methylation domain-containing protein